ncbi:MAG: glycosyltransferase [Propionibacteriaceae bacterium]
MIGYYVHHQGSGHLHRATAIDAQLDTPLTGLSSQTRPPSWRGDWIRLSDDSGGEPDQQLTAGGALHYAPVHHRGLRTRMAQISSWIDRAQPEALVVDVSVEVALLARLHGIPVVTLAMPGRRDDRPHQLGYDVSRRIIAPWPERAASMWPGASADQRAKTTFVGAISRFAPVDRPTSVPRRVVVLNGTGGGGPGAADVAAARRAAPHWEWIHLDRSSGTWVDDPWPLLCSASVVVSHTGQNALAEIAAARKPAVLIPQDRPFDEQRTTANALMDFGGLPALVSDCWPQPGEWAALLGRAAQYDGRAWSQWNDGLGAARAAELLGQQSRTLQSVSA